MSQDRTRVIVVLLVALTPLLSCILPGVDPLPSPTPSTIVVQTLYKPYNYVPSAGSTNPVHAEPTDYPALIVVSSTTSVQRDIILGEGFLYTVERGDNLHDLAERLCGDARLYKRLLRLNGMEEGEVLEVGREIVVSCG